MNTIIFKEKMKSLYVIIIQQLQYLIICFATLWHVVVERNRALSMAVAKAKEQTEIANGRTSKDEYEA